MFIWIEHLHYCIQMCVCVCMVPCWTGVNALHPVFLGHTPYPQQLWSGILKINDEWMNNFHDLLLFPAGKKTYLSMQTYHYNWQYSEMVYIRMILTKALQIYKK